MLQSLFIRLVICPYKQIIHIDFLDFWLKIYRNKARLQKIDILPPVYYLDIKKFNTFSQEFPTNKYKKYLKSMIQMYQSKYESIK